MECNRFTEYPRQESKYNQYQCKEERPPSGSRLFPPDPEISHFPAFPDEAKTTRDAKHCTQNGYDLNHDNCSSNIQVHPKRLYLLDGHSGTCYIFAMLTFLKLGGSLITDKTHPYTPRLEIMDELAGQIAMALHENPALQLVLGHGSGSFGHEAASKFGTRAGVSGEEAWRGFAEVWYQASSLNRLVVEALHKAGLPAVTLAPLSMVTANEGKVTAWELASLKSALENGLLPVIHGDVIFDKKRGGTILSTEDLFCHLARELNPKRILLAGLEEGVWEDFPARNRLIKEITPLSFSAKSSGVVGSTGADVTGGMKAKVTEMLKLVEQSADLEVLIFSGEEAGNVRRALQGENPGTRLHC
jgi:isopentenyl phosphate kinase